MFMKSFLGACIAGVALSVSLKFNHLEHETPSSLAQILNATDIAADVCQRAPTWNKMDVDDFYTLYD